MAINHNKNVNIQITLSKADNEKLLSIKEQLSENLNIDLSKSQTIAFLIKNFGATPKPSQTLTEQPKKANSNNINYQYQIKALKDKLNVSFTRLSEIIGIPPSTLKKYANGSQQPKAENEEIIKHALATYGLK